MEKTLLFKHDESLKKGMFNLKNLTNQHYMRLYRPL
jgi:hypothetical protein